MDIEQQLNDIKSLTTTKHKHPHENYYATIKLEYVQGIIDKNTDKRRYPSILELAKKYKIKQQTLNVYANRDNWKVQRKEFQIRMEVACENKRIAKISDGIVAFDDKCFHLANKLIEKVEHMIETGEVIGKDGEIKPLDPFVIESMCRGLEKAQKVGRLAAGETTNNERKEHVVTFSAGLDMIRKNLESNPDMLKRLKDETVDRDVIDMKQDEENVFSKIKIGEDIAT